MQRLPGIDIAVLAIYLAAVVGLGAWFARRNRTSAHFMAASGMLPGWAVGLSIFGTFLSSTTFIGVPGKAYGGNWNAFVFSLTLPLAAWVAVKYFVPFYRASGEISAYHHLEKRFGPWARSYARACYLLTQLARVGAILFGVSMALHALTGWSLPAIIIGAGVAVTLYTLFGGIEAVIWTDVIQSLVLLAGAVVIAAADRGVGAVPSAVAALALLLLARVRSAAAVGVSNTCMFFYRRIPMPIYTCAFL